MKQINFFSLFFVFILSSLFFVTGTVYAASVTVVWNTPSASYQNSDWDNQGSWTQIGSTLIGFTAGEGLKFAWSATGILPSANCRPGVAVIKMVYESEIWAGHPSQYKTIYNRVVVGQSCDIYMTGMITADNCGNTYATHVNFYVESASPYSTDDCPEGSLIRNGICITSTVSPPIIYSTGDCPAGSVIQDGICIKAAVTPTSYSTDNCPTGSVIQDGICIKAAVTPTPYSTNNCPAGSVIQDGICIKAYALICGNNIADATEQCDGTDNLNCGGTSCIAPGQTNSCTCATAVCGDNIVTGAEQCDGTALSSCPGLCILPGQPNECTCASLVCGNNIVEGEEQCDGAANSACLGALCITAGQPNECTCPSPTSSPNPPAVVLLPPEDNYCAGMANFRWQYNTQDSWQMQISTGSDFSNEHIIFDSNRVDNSATSIQSFIVSLTSTDSCALTHNCNRINYRVPYYWRVQIWNGALGSGWVNYSDAGDADGDDNPNTYTYPYPHPPPAVSYEPSSNITPYTQAVFTDLSVCYKDDGTYYPCKCLTSGSTSEICLANNEHRVACTAAGIGGHCYVWWFNTNNLTDPTLQSLIIGDASHAYSAPNTSPGYPTKLQICDDRGCCSLSKPVSVGGNNGNVVPQWWEISPYNQ